MTDGKILIVGAGLSGATLAEHLARDGHSIVVVDKRDHIGGNVYDEIDFVTGIRVSKYGAHIFHTNDEEVWNYVNKFGAWKRWDHRVLADCSGVFVPVPVCIETVNQLFGESIQSESEMRDWIQRETSQFNRPILNSEGVALSRVGQRLYNTLFRDYTMKQWAKDPSELEPSVLERIPLRISSDTRYFGDRFQGLPERGYTSIVYNMLRHPNIEVRLETDWEAVKDLSWKAILFTGPIDTYFKDAGLPPLEYRSIQFHWERLIEKGYRQPNSVINYPRFNTPFTRSVEYKHFLHQQSEWTIIASETTTDIGEPYYPVPTQRNRDLYEAYRALAGHVGNKVHFVGRLASYKYLNMDQAIRNAMDYYKEHLQGKI